ncbi:MAG: protein-L-isoaspartate(D-aspartate) O-methyltransferase [Candidatus Omnitrophota bacterium]|nr:protein-L-isoaspartate(D-aspartate) O-methyltransferase [Candidatus Omnitrophota bacterium]
MFFLFFTGLIFNGPARAREGDVFDERKKDMVRDQIKRRGIKDERVLGAMEKVDRHLFVPDSLRYAAYRDSPLPIGHGQTISQPYIVAFMTEAARLEPGDRVLEIGTGCGYQAAVLAEIVKEVYTIEILKELADSARERLKDLGYGNVKVKWGDGYRGWAEEAPFDAIIVTAAPPDIPMKLIDQLKAGGRMVIPVGGFFQELYLVTKTGKGYEKKAILPVRFVPMVRSEPGAGQE